MYPYFGYCPGEYKGQESSQNTKYCILVTDGEIDPTPSSEDEEVRRDITGILGFW